MERKEEEFQYGRGKRSTLDNFSLSREWQKGYGIDRFSPAYITNCHSTAPQAVFKIISFSSGSQASGNGFGKALLDYVNFRKGKKIEVDDLDAYKEAGIKTLSDPDGNHYEAVAQEFYTESGEVMQGQEDIDQLYQDWSQDFTITGSGQGKQRNITHMLLSADVEPTQRNANSVLAAAQKTLREEFGQFGFDYIYVLHTDTEHPHVHVTLKNYNNRTRRKLRLDRHDLLRVRTEFANQLVDRGLKKHIATLRRDRPDTLLKVQDTISKIKEQEKLIRKTINESNFYRRPSQLSAQINKQVKEHDYKDLSVVFDSSDTSQLKIVANKAGAHVEKLLKHLAFDIGSKSFNLGVEDDTASITLHDISNLSIEDRKQVGDNFKKLARNKEVLQQQKLIKKTKDASSQYKFALKGAIKSIDWIKKNKQLTLKQKKETIKQLQEIKSRLIDNYDINNISDVHTVVSAQVGDKAAKEALRIEQRGEMPALEFHKRKRSLEKYLDQHKKDLKDVARDYKNRGDQEMVVAVKGLASAKGNKDYIKAQNKLQKQALSRLQNKEL